MNILLTSVGRRKYIVEYFRAALSGKGKVLATNSTLTNSLLAADYHELSPLIYHDEYIPFLIEFCKRNDVSAVLSLFDIDLLVLAKNKKEFDKIGVRFVGPSVSTAKISNDKLETHHFLKQIGLLSPETYGNLDAARCAIDERRLNFPLIIKPRFGMGSIGVFVAYDKYELEVLYRRCLNEIFNSYLQYESKGEQDKAVLIQERLIGQEYGLDLYKDLNENLVSIVAKSKISMRSGETDVGEVVSPTPFEDFSVKIGNALKFSGLLSIDCFITSSGVYCTEINPRISGHYPFAHLAGVRYPDQLVSWLEGGDTKTEWLTAKVGVRGSKELSPQLLFN